MYINSLTKITGLIGYPIKHTLSPIMHNAAFKKLNLNFVYLPFEVKPDKLDSAIESIRALNFTGLNVTIPFKSEALKFVDELDPLAKKIGSINTIVNDKGILKGYNTDASGFMKDLEIQGVNPKDKTIILYGAGGAAKSLAAILAQSKIKKIFITDLNDNRASELANQISNAEHIRLANFKSKLPETDIFINATPLGMNEGDPSPIDISYVKKRIFIYDLIYHRKTRLLQLAKKSKIKSSNGIGMLLHQGALSFELWTQKKAPIKIMHNELKKYVAN